jgi:hypothetical protein
MATVKSTLESNATRSTLKDEEIYKLIQISRRIPINILHVGRNQHKLLEKLESLIAGDIEGKCIVQGFVQPNSVKVSHFSAGVVQAAKVVFEVTFTCNVCKPETNDILHCITKNVTKAGIRAEVRDYRESKNGRVISPVVIFVARDHFGGNDEIFEHVCEGQAIQVQVVGQRFELYDKYISVIAKLYTGVDSDLENEPMDTTGI